MPKVGATYRHWTAYEDELLLKLRSADRLEWAEVGKRMKRTRGACSNRYSFLTGTSRKLPTYAGGFVYDKPIKTLAEIHDARLQTPSERRRERERIERAAAADARARAEWQAGGCITSSYFGDPPPGWSALDRKRKAQHA